MRRVFFPLLMLSLVCACSGLRGKADDLFEQGAYWEAVQAYEAALTEDPRDEKALAGLKRARTSHIDKKLIEVRMARLAGNEKLAIDLLLDLIINESKWSFFPVGAIAGTQEEESAEALRFVEAQVESSIHKERPLLGLYLLNHYQPIFSGALAGRREYLLTRLSKSGKVQCETLARTESSKHPYYSDFVRKVCTAWGISDKGARNLASKRDGLYRGVRVASNIQGLPAEYRVGVQSALEEAFETTPWYDPKGKRVLELALSGNFRLDHQKIAENRVHGYTVQIPYTDYQIVTKTRKVPYTEYTPSPVTRYRDETYSEKEPVTRYRDETRYQDYSGWNHHQELELRAQGSVSLGNITKPVHIEQQTRQDAFEHHWNLPQIGLRPENPSLEDPETWVKQQAAVLGTDLSQEADAIWEGLYCEPGASEPTLLATGDQVQRCLRKRFKEPPPFAEAWYQKFFGITVAQANDLLNLSDL